ncbi:MAG: D-amino-acid transaminase [Nitrospirales bacterium]|nr:D-amino-acid transaminase [Nitrospira sp.]MDR4500134.1 D-amino-acid transaminase [Nitrospirales bacterium]
MPNIGYLNGQFMPLAQMQVSVEDRGYQFGDGVYEVIRTYQGVPFRMEEHLERLARSAHEIKISLPLTRQEWGMAIQDGIQRSGYKNCKVYIQVTRGAAPREHLFAASLAPTVVMTIREMSELDPRFYTQGVRAIMLPDIRWGRCDIKSLNLLPNVLAKQKAAEAGAFEAIFVRDRVVTEGASSNVMIVKDRKIWTPELNEHVLPGVTLKYVMCLARENGYDVQERRIFSEELGEADEIFLVGTTIHVLSVTQIDTISVGNGLPGPITQALMSQFAEAVEKSSAISIN